MPEEWFEVSEINGRLLLHGKARDSKHVELWLNDAETRQVHAFMEKFTDDEQALFARIFRAR